MNILKYYLRTNSIIKAKDESKHINGLFSSFLYKKKDRINYPLKTLKKTVTNSGSN